MATRMPRSALTQAHLKRILNYNALTGEFTWIADTGIATRAGMRAGHKDQQGYIVIGIGGTSFKGSRLAWLYMTGEFPKHQLDHSDGDRSNNIFANLREVTQAQNAKNRRAKRGAKYKGVFKNRDAFISSIHVDGKRHYLGYFFDPLEAALAYDEAARKFHGKFAALNFPRDDEGRAL